VCMWLIAGVVEDKRTCVLSIGSQTVAVSNTRGSASFAGAGCFLVTNVNSEKVCRFGNSYNSHRMHIVTR